MHDSVVAAVAVDGHFAAQPRGFVKVSPAVPSLVITIPPSREETTRKQSNKGVRNMIAQQCQSPTGTMYAFYVIGTDSEPYTIYI